MITLTKLAKLANVSVSTASKAFSGSPEVNDETRDLIFKVAKENGCFKKFYNVKYPKLVIAVIAPEFESRYYTRYLSILQGVLAEKNCEICVSTTDFSAERENELIDYYYRHSNVDGIIVIASISQTRIDDKYEIPVVYMGNVISEDNTKNHNENMNFALNDVSKYLKDKGVDKVGFVGEKLTLGKLNGIVKSLADVGICLDDKYVSISEKRFEQGGYFAMEKLFSENRVPRALICAYDYMAIGAIRSIYNHGLSVPEDIAVLGMDNIPEAEFLNPPLASVSTPIEEICKFSAELVVCRIKGDPLPHQKDFCFEFVLRRSFEI